MEDSENEKKPIYLFGRDITKVPCFRNSFLYGIYAGFAGGLVTFFCTSKPRLATHMAVGSFAVTTIGYWIHCRYNYSKTKFYYAQLKAGLQAHVMYEGTPAEKELKKSD